ncbi:LysR family transcriptional regulator [Aestuariibacter halophilus]|uniref:LysR family transcriptional regulator n=1 Tax=Fluctibacter halophilus TaxID=226011 RepID=A0ABS8GET0_9ALTE|nr:LysR family transcriptional regulator [Aestuariibacter halophilus]MCC2617716.1 LysR family transcriptional regulator [Aestuariibacter halophilus]
MDLRSLHYFVAVYDTGSFSAASKQCFIAQPSISASVKHLEDELSQQLFLRSARGVKPTEAGQQLYPLAQRLLSQASAIREIFSDKQQRYPFRLGLIKGLGVARMSTLLKQFTAAIDQMELTLVPGTAECDARIISANMCRGQEHFVPMWQEQYQLAIPASHPLALQTTIGLDQLANQPFIQRTPCEGWNSLWEKLQGQDIRLDIRARITTIEYAMGLVRAGLGCAYIPIPLDAADQQDIVFRPISELDQTRQIGLAYRHRSDTIDTLSRLVSSF